MLEDKNLGTIWGIKWQRALDWISRGRERRTRIRKAFQKWRTREWKAFSKKTSFEIRSVEHRLSTNRAKQKVFYKNFKNFDQLRTRFYQSKNRFNWSSANWGSIEPSETKLKKFKEFSIGQKTHSIDWTSRKIEFLKNNRSFM